MDPAAPPRMERERRFPSSCAKSQDLTELQIKSMRRCICSKNMRVDFV